MSALKVGSTQVSPTEIGISESASPKVGAAQVGSTQIRFNEPRSIDANPTQINSTKIDFVKLTYPPFSISKIGSTQVNPNQVVPTSLNGRNDRPSKISFPSSIQFQDFIDTYTPFGHEATSPYIYFLNSTALALWNTLIQPQSLFDVNLEIINLPNGQLAEAQVTKFDTSGRPIGGTILIDDDANGVGWYIDPTPSDHSEYAQALNSNAYRATTGAAAGKYDLFTTVLHEMGHIAGFISGHEGFDRHIKTQNGTPIFVTDNLNVTLTPDGSHLDSQLYPFDLMNTTLSPGVRKLPSTLNLQLLKAIREDKGNIATTGQNAPKAALTSAPLIAILNSDFNIANPDDPNFGWNRRGAATITGGQAILTEDSPLMSKFSQTFIVPEGAKTLQFTLTNTQLGHSDLAPPDAFEVALLDSNTKTSLLGATKGLTLTDSFLNLQADGTAYYSDGVNFRGATDSGNQISLNNSRVISLDISHSLQQIPPYLNKRAS